VFVVWGGYLLKGWIGPQFRGKPRGGRGGGRGGTPQRSEANTPRGGGGRGTNTPRPANRGTPNPAAPHPEDEASALAHHAEVPRLPITITI
jgi:hypothetical protein